MYVRKIHDDPSLNSKNQRLSAMIAAADRSVSPVWQSVLQKSTEKSSSK
jgi:hypothetical protein